MPTRSLSSRVASLSGSRVSSGESGPRAKTQEAPEPKKAGKAASTEAGARVASTESGPRAKTTEPEAAPKKTGWIASTEASRVGK